MTMFIRSLLEQASAQASRTSALNPLAWLIGILLAGTVSVIVSSENQWLSVVLCVLTVIAVVLYLAAYIYLLFHDRDALRSETYSLQKLAIERGVFGDSLSGTVIIDETKVEDMSLLSSPTESSTWWASVTKYFAVLVDEPSAEDSAKITEVARKSGAWWHWIAGCWLLKDSNDGRTVDIIRDEVYDLFQDHGRPRILVLEVNPVTWSGFGPSSESKNMFNWLRSTWKR